MPVLFVARTEGAVRVVTVLTATTGPRVTTRRLRQIGSIDAASQERAA